VLAAITELRLPGLAVEEAPRATLDQVARIHPRPYVDALLAALPADRLGRIDADTVVGPGSGEAALRAAGAAVAAVDAVLGGTVPRAFCAVRPPGHHAEPSRAMGFCLFNSIAIAAAHARAVHHIERIAIVDFDVHHGNGTQAAFWDDRHTLFASTHQWPLYPGTGRADERGAFGYIVNCPLPPGTDGASFRAVVEEKVLPAVDRWAPELVLVSAGFDAHARDPLANLELEEEDFAWVTGAVVALAGHHAAGRVVSTLEGGYDTAALAASVVAHLQALAA
jgi:acetoin utilization deacetylase AcuC-like enzyme